MSPATINCLFHHQFSGGKTGSGQEQYVKYTYYEKSDSGGYGDQTQISKHETEMFAFTFQGLVCLVNEVRNGPPENKPAAYKTVVENLIRVVETYASSRGVDPSQLFSDQEFPEEEAESRRRRAIHPQEVDLNMYKKLKALAACGDYSDVDLVESTVDGVSSSFGKVLGGVLQSLGMVLSDVLKTVTGLLGGVTGGVLGGFTEGVVGDR